MIDTVTNYAEVIGLLAIAVGISWLVYQIGGPGWSLIVFGAVILSMSACVAVLARRRGGTA
jgi:membrane protein YdbS with pleckstrin-like domain